MWLKTKSGIINTDQFLKIFHDREYVRGLYNSAKNTSTHFMIIKAENSKKASIVVDLIYDTLSRGEKTLSLINHEYSDPVSESIQPENLLEELERLRKSASKPQPNF